MMALSKSAPWFHRGESLTYQCRVISGRALFVLVFGEPGVQFPF